MKLRLMLFVWLLPLTSSWLEAETVYFSTRATIAIGGITVRDGDIIRYNTLTDTATLLFDEDLFQGNEGIDAFDYLDDGTFLMSTNTNAVLGGLSFTAGDVVAYDPLTDTASLFFDSSLLSGNTNVDAFDLLADGTMLLSTVGNTTLGGLSFRDGDIVRYDMTTSTATLFFNEDLFAAGEQIDAIHLMPNGNLRLSTSAAATLGGIQFEDGDIVEYNFSTNTATVVLSEGTFGRSLDIDAFSVPEAACSPLALLAAALLLGRMKAEG